MKPNNLDKTSFASAFLLLLFGAGLGLAMLLVKARSAIQLSEPILLPGEGLSVVLPAGPGWKNLTEWSYEQDNSFTLVATYSMRGSPPSEVRWQYKLADQPLAPQALLEQIARQFSGPVSAVQTFQGPLTFAQIQLFSRAEGEQILLAAAVPQKGRILLLQLKSYSEHYDLPDLFEQLAARVQFRPDPRRQVGRQLFEDLTSRLYPQWLENLHQRAEIFLLSPVSGRPIGYSKTAAVKSEKDLAAAFEQEQVFRQNDSPQSVSRFESAQNLSEFLWTTARQTRRGPLQTQVRRLPDGSMQIEDSYRRQTVCWPAKEAVPEILLPLAARAMLNADESEAVLDIIASFGQVVPVLVSRSEPKNKTNLPEQTEYAVKVQFLHHSENYEEYYFDTKQNLLARLEAIPGQPARIWKAAGEADLRRFNPSFSKPDQIVLKQSPSGMFALQR
ncbi:MAG TPA: hypothetical protein PKY88_11170 [Anaerohalosphaeraceae bacterium]|nr:hypothetical protein [Anaerohalosphaeraceae bacterium]